MRYKLFILVLILILFAVILKLKDVKFYNVNIEFLKLKVVKEKLSIYYNGMKIGRVKKLTPCLFSKGTCAKSVIVDKGMHLPNNMQAIMKQRKINDKKYIDYIELIYPDNPSEYSLNDGDIIKGRLAGGFHNYLNEEIEYNEMEELKNSLVATTKNLEKSTSYLVEILYSLNNMTQNIQNDIENAAKNLNGTSKNIKSMTQNLNTNKNRENINNILNNTNDISNTLNYTSSNIAEITQNIQNSDILNRSNSITKNLDEILGGMNCTMKKPFSGLRVLFGKIIN